MKSRSSEIGILNRRIALKFDLSNFKAIVQSRYKSRGFETLRSLSIRRLIRYWNRVLVTWCLDSVLGGVRLNPRIVSLWSIVTQENLLVVTLHHSDCDAQHWKRSTRFIWWHLYHALSNRYAAIYQLVRESEAYMHASVNLVIIAQIMASCFAGSLLTGPLVTNSEYNSSLPSAAYMRWWTGLALIQVMAFHLFGAKPLPEPSFDYA